MPVSFSPFEQFERAIVRFLKSDGKEEAGAGFLIDHNHVVTCAHVVNAMLGLADQSSDYPMEPISLEFVQVREMRSARVVGWHPALETGEIFLNTLEDLAILQLNEPPPPGAIAMGPFLSVEYSVGGSFKALGFADEGGRWAYGILRDRWPTTGWIQLEAERAEGKRVKGGFSGTPIWDEQQQKIVGIVVAADREEGDRVAMAIPTEKIRLALRKLDVENLMSILQFPVDVSKKWTGLYNLVKPAGYWVNCPSLPYDFLKALQDMPSQPNAPGDSLLLFVAGLLLDLDLSKGLRDRLTEWLEVRTPNRINLEKYIRAFELPDDRTQVANIEAEPCVLVVLEKSVQSPGSYRVQAWAMGDRHQPRHELLQDGEAPLITLADLPQWLGMLKTRMAPYAWTGHTIEIFLPLELLNEAIDQIAPEEDDFDALFALPLGCEYRVVVRFSERLQETYKYRGEWQQKWRHLQSYRQDCARQRLRLGDCASENDLKTLVRDLVRPDVIGIRRSQPPESDLRRSILAASLRTGLPVAAWVRCDRPDLNRMEELDRVITGPLAALPDRVHEARRKNTEIGQHLSLMWDDPTCLPPGYLDSSMVS
ncbi:MAG: hypothetical protein Fur0042_19750 [Cyanophyceae cyanobacterium]